MRERPRRARNRDRGVSVTVNYVLVLGIVAILVSGLFVATSTVVSDQRDRTVTAELSVLGNRIADDLTTADRLAAVDGTQTVRLRTSLPDRVAGSTYRVTVRKRGPGEYAVVLEAGDPGVSVVVPVTSTTPVTTGTFDGGDLVFEYDPAADAYEVTDAGS